MHSLIHHDLPSTGVPLDFSLLLRADFKDWRCIVVSACDNKDGKDGNGRDTETDGVVNRAAMDSGYP